MNKKLKIALTIMALPLIFSMYFCDRFITIAFPLADVHPIQKWLFDSKSMSYSLIRVSIVGLLIGMYFIISSLF